MSVRRQSGRLEGLRLGTRQDPGHDTDRLGKSSGHSCSSKSIGKDMKTIFIYL